MQKKSKILITGGAGFIGSAIARFLLGRGFENVFIFDNFSTGRREDVPEGCRIIRGDIRKEKDLAGLPGGI
ncbi:MAG: NAD-dependent epimerase/dehydratase family protein, partial [Candidatus Omnitrophica bacterium]|nr:NAD-dependent epimerase/dehydratase family protein [Candidatus Omnitrophota bacterium]